MFGLGGDFSGFACQVQGKGNGAVVAGLDELGQGGGVADAVLALEGLNAGGAVAKGAGVGDGTTRCCMGCDGR